MPKEINKNPSAISLTIGEVTKKVKVTPSGMPDSTNPIKIGTVLQLQNGDNTPNTEATMCAQTPLNFDKTFFTFSGGKKLLIKDIINIMKLNKIIIFKLSYIKKFTASAKESPALKDILNLLSSQLVKFTK